MKPSIFLKSYLNARDMGRSFETRSQFELWQKHYLNRFLRFQVQNFPAYGRMGGHQPRLDDFAFSGKEHLLENMEGYTRSGHSAEDLRTAILNEDTLRDAQGRRLFAGHSSGTGGHPGYYLFDKAEQSALIGTALGKLLPDFWKKRTTVTVVLPRNTPLYTGVGRLPWFKVNFVSARQDIETIVDEVEKSNPDVLICSPRIVTTLVHSMMAPRLKRIILGSEVVEPGLMGELRAYGYSVEQIYMTTEGLLATSCAHGNLHLAEDQMHFEFDDTSCFMVNPIITDFNRHSMLMLRYKMNDLMYLSREPCSCGSPFHVVEKIVGRLDDTFICERIPPLSDGVIPFHPDRIRDEFLKLADLDDWSIEQISFNKGILYLPDWNSGLDLMGAEGERLCQSLKEFFLFNRAQMDFTVKPISYAEHIERKTGPEKLRRVKRSWKPYTDGNIFYEDPDHRRPRPGCEPYCHGTWPARS